uniref:Atg4a n=1 Tax=Arundo donax TaxID=35708 RepID=A0A0A9GYH5_ARUDO
MTPHVRLCSICQGTTRHWRSEPCCTPEDATLSRCTRFSSKSSTNHRIPRTLVTSSCTVPMSPAAPQRW